MKPRVSRITKYSEDYKDQLMADFFKAFRKDPRKFVEKLKACSMAKGTYSYLLNGKTRPDKRSIESMRAFIENRAPKYTLVQAGEFYCGCCEQILAESARASGNQWECTKCHTEVKYNSMHRTGNYQKYQRYRFIMQGTPGEYRDRYLAKRRSYYLKVNYGKFAKCMEMVMKLKKEMKYVQSK